MKFKLVETKEDIKIAIQKITPAMAENYFGTTTNFDKGAFILPNGKVLDFSDGEYARSRTHSDIALASPTCRKYQNSMVMAELGGTATGEFVKNGSIMMVGNTSVNEGDFPESILGLPISVTDTQWITIEKFLNYIDTKSFMWWSLKEDGNIHSYEKPFDTTKILEDMHIVYNK